MLRSQWNRTPKSFIPAAKQEELCTPNLTVAPARRGFEDPDLYHQPQALLTYELSLKQRKVLDCCVSAAGLSKSLSVLHKEKTYWHLNWFTYANGRKKVFKLAYCKAIFQISLIGVNYQTNLNNLSFLLRQEGACKRGLQWSSYWYINLFTLQARLTQTKPEQAVLGQKKREKAEISTGRSQGKWQGNQ